MPVARLAHVVAAWIRTLEGVDGQGRAIEINDPLKEQLQAALASAGNTAEAKVTAILKFEQVFGGGLADSNQFRNAVLMAYVFIAGRGIQAATSALNKVTNQQ